MRYCGATHLFKGFQRLGSGRARPGRPPRPRVGCRVAGFEWPSPRAGRGAFRSAGKCPPEPGARGRPSERDPRVSDDPRCRCRPPRRRPLWDRPADLSGSGGHVLGTKSPGGCSADSLNPAGLPTQTVSPARVSQRHRASADTELRANRLVPRLDRHTSRPARRWDSGPRDRRGCCQPRTWRTGPR